MARRAAKQGEGVEEPLTQAQLIAEERASQVQAEQEVSSEPQNPTLKALVLEAQPICMDHEAMKEMMCLKMLDSIVVWKPESELRDPSRCMMASRQ